jgi:hypothetical protein
MLWSAAAGALFGGLAGIVCYYGLEDRKRSRGKNATHPSCRDSAAQGEAGPPNEVSHPETSSHGNRALPHEDQVSTSDGSWQSDYTEARETLAKKGEQKGMQNPFTLRTRL